MRRSQLLRVALLGLAGLAIAGGIGYAAHVAAGDEVGLSAGGIAAGDRLAPPEAATGADQAVATEPSVSAPTVETAPPASEPPATGTDAPTTTERGRAGPVRGRTVFASAGCGQCHTLAAAKATGKVGPSLDRLAPTRAEVIAQVRAGGGGMPSFAETLSEAEIRAVAAFVATNARPPAPAPPAPPPAAPADDDSSGKGSGSDDSGSDDSGGDDSSGRGRGRGRGGDDRDD